MGEAPRLLWPRACVSPLPTIPPYAPAAFCFLCPQVLKFNFEQPDEAVAVVEGPVPQPGQGQVLVKLKLRPVNPGTRRLLDGWLQLWTLAVRACGTR